MGKHGKIPKKIWIYWHQGLDQAPDLVQKCVGSWRLYNSDYEVYVLDQQSYKTYVSLDASLTKRLLNKSIASFSDMLRLALLQKYGGVWVDSTLLCLKPLEEWLPNEQELVAFRNPGPDRLLSSWFLAAPIDSYLIDQWSLACRTYWEQWRWRRPYYWLHYRFGFVYKKDDTFRQLWDNGVTLDSKGPHHLTPFKQKFFQTATEERIKEIRSLDVPCLKLTYKPLEAGYPKHSMIDYVLHSL